MVGKLETEREGGEAPLPVVRPEIARVAASRSAEQARRELEQARRIVIVTKFRYMGDTVVATPFFAQLRRHYPDAEITLITSTAAATALSTCPYLDHLIPLENPSRRRRQHSRELLTLLREGGYQAAFLLNRSLHCAVICTLAHIPARIGYVSEWRGPFLSVRIPYNFDRNEVECHLDMLRALGLPAEDALPELWITEAERRRARAILSERGWPGSGEGRPLIGIQPGANDPGIREWGAERYARVADALIAETGGCVVIMGGKAERETAERMVKAMQRSAINLVGALELREALAVIGQCDLWLGNDSGLLHAAVALRVASVGMYGPNKVVRWGYEAPRHRSLVVLPERPARNDNAVRRYLSAIPETLALETARELIRPPEPDGYSCPLPFDRPPYFAATLAPAQIFSARRR